MPRQEQGLTYLARLRGTPGLAGYAGRLLPYMISLVTGLLLALLTWWPGLWQGGFMGIVLVPLFIALEEADPKQFYLCGLLFHAAWLLPATAWYASALSPVTAFVLPFFLILFQALFFLIFMQHGRWSYPVTLLVFSAACALWVFVLPHLPLLNRYQIPDLSDAVWRNPLWMQAARLGGEATVTLAVLLVNGLMAVIVLRGPRRLDVPLGWGAFVLVFFIGGGLLLQRFVPDPLADSGILRLSLQCRLSSEDGRASDSDLKRLIDLSDATLENIGWPPASVPENTAAPAILTVWPASGLDDEQTEAAASYAARQGIYLLTHTVSDTSDDLYPRSSYTLWGPDGQAILETLPVTDEPGHPYQTAAASYKIPVVGLRQGFVVTAVAAYDLHDPQIVQRLGTLPNLIIASGDSPATGRLARQFMAADAVTRSLQSGIPLLLATTDGPTLYCMGGVVQGLPYGHDGVIVRGAQ